MIQFKTSEILVLTAAIVMSVLANLPDSIVGSIDKRWLLGSLAALVVVAMFKYLQVFLLAIITILVIGANIPSELAGALNISQPALLVSLIAIVGLTLYNRIHPFPSSKKIISVELLDWRETMMSAISDGNEAVVRQLLAMHQDVNFTHGGMSPIFFAAELGNLNMVRILITYGANMYLRNKEGKTPLEVASVNMKHSPPVIADPLLFMGDYRHMRHDPR